MWRRLQQQYHLRTTRETVGRLLLQVNPTGVADRREHRLRRRTYVSRRPNHTWHLDGYDKLRPYGILISGYSAILYKHVMFSVLDQQQLNSVVCDTLLTSKNLLLVCKC